MLIRTERLKPEHPIFAFNQTLFCAFSALNTPSNIRNLGPLDANAEFRRAAFSDQAPPPANIP